MEDTARELTELKKEIVESRNQAIKTDNQMKNLTLDVKGFEKRFDGLERRVRIAGIGVNAIVAVVIATAAYLIHAASSHALHNEIDSLTARAAEAEKNAETEIAQMKSRMAQNDAAAKARAATDAALLKIVELGEAKKEAEAIAQWESIDPSKLTALHQKMLGPKLEDLRVKAGELAYKKGKDLLDKDREKAVAAFNRSLELSPEGRYATRCHYYLMTSLWNLQRFNEVGPHLDVLKKSDPQDALKDEIRYYEAAVLARLGKVTEAKRLFKRAISANTRFQNSSKAYLTALEEGGQLPPVR